MTATDDLTGDNKNVAGDGAGKDVAALCGKWDYSREQVDL